MPRGWQSSSRRGLYLVLLYLVRRADVAQDAAAALRDHHEVQEDPDRDRPGEASADELRVLLDQDRAEHQRPDQRGPVHQRAPPPVAKRPPGHHPPPLPEQNPPTTSPQPSRPHNPTPHQHP